MCAISPYGNCWSFLTSASKYEEPHPLLSRAAIPILYRFVINFKPCTNSSHCCERKTRSLAVFLVAKFSSSWLRTLQWLRVTIRRLYVTGRKETQFVEFASRFIWTKETTNCINDSLKKCLAKLICLLVLSLYRGKVSSPSFKIICLKKMWSEI